jgi:hypothetical protein
LLALGNNCHCLESTRDALHNFRSTLAKVSELVQLLFVAEALAVAWVQALG